MDETSRLVVQVSNQGINETNSLLGQLVNYSRSAEIGVAELAKQIQLLNLSTKENYIGLYDINKTLLDLGSTTRKQAQDNRESGESFGSLALKIAGYSSALNLGISVVRGAAREMKDLAVEAVNLAGSFERSRVAWGVFLKDVDAGSAMFDKLYDLAQRTPLSFQGVESAAQMLKGFGLATEEIIPTLERMGDVARGNDETMQRLSLAYGQALAQGKVLTRDLYQFVNAGVPIFDALSQVMGKSVEQVQQLVTDGKVGFPEIEAALKSLTEQGGQFEGMMDKASQTFEGKLSIAKDNWKAMLAELGSSWQGTLKGMLDDFNKFSENTLNKHNINSVLLTGGTTGNIESAIAYAKAQNQSGITEVNTNAAYAAGLSTKNETGGLTWAMLLAALEKVQAARKAEVSQNALEARRLTYGTSVPANNAAKDWNDRAVWEPVIAKATEQPMGVRAVKDKNGNVTDWVSWNGAQYVDAWWQENWAGKVDKTPIDDTEGEQFVRKQVTEALSELKKRLFGEGYIEGKAINEIKYYENLFGYKKNVEAPWSGTYYDPYATKVGAGIPYLTQAQALSQLAPMDQYWLPGIEADNADVADADAKARNAIKARALGWNYGTDFALNPLAASIVNRGRFQRNYRPGSDAWTRSRNDMDFFGAPWMMRAQYGTSEPPDYEAQAPIPDFETFIGYSGGAATAQHDRENAIRMSFMLKYGMSPEEYLAENFGGTGEKYLGGKFTPQANGADEAMNILGFLAGGSRNPSDPFAFANIDTLMNGGQVSASEYPENAAPESPWAGMLYDNLRAMEGLGPTETVTGAGTWEYPIKPELTPDYGLGNIDLNNRPILHNADGSISTVRSFSNWDDYLEKEVLVPTVGPNGEDWSEAEAWDYYLRSGKYLGKFDTYQEADAYAESLHQKQEPMYSPYAEKKFIPGKTETRGINDFFGKGSWRQGNASGDVSRPYEVATTDAEKYAAAQEELADAMAAGEISVAGYNQRMRELAETYDPATKLAKQFGDAILSTSVNTLADELTDLGSALLTSADGWTSFGDAMGDTLEKIVKMLPKLAIQVGLSMLGNLNPADDALGWALIGGGLVGSIGAGMLKSNATGGVYVSPSLHQYANGVYDRPQTFAFARGGVFAEAGPEAIMPLSRDSSGRLGVAAQGGAKVSVEVHNYSSTPISSKTQTLTDAAGNKKIIMTIREIARQEVATANAGGVRKSY